MDILRAAAYQRMPWKNGGGETFEIAISPPGATFDTLDWRVSMAVVAQDGPFSLFPGIDRTLCILDGPGLALDFDQDDGTHTVTRDSAPLHFAADRAVNARLLGGPITDLNVMTRRSRYRHTVHRLVIDKRQTVATSAEQALLICPSGDTECVVSGSAPVHLGARDGVLVRGTPCVFELAATRSVASAYLIQFYPATTPA